MKLGKFKWTSPCCSATMRKDYDRDGLENFYCMKCGKYVPWMKIILTEGRYVLISQCCNDSIKITHAKDGMESYHCMKCGKCVPIEKIRGVIQKSMEEWIEDTNSDSE